MAAKNTAAGSVPFFIGGGVYRHQRAGLGSII